MFAFYTSLILESRLERAKYSKFCVSLTDLELDTEWGRDHRNLIEAFVYSEFDMNRGNCKHNTERNNGNISASKRKTIEITVLTGLFGYMYFYT